MNELDWKAVFRTQHYLDGQKLLPCLIEGLGDKTDQSTADGSDGRPCVPHAPADGTTGLLQTIDV